MNKKNAADLDLLRLIDTHVGIGTKNDDVLIVARLKGRRKSQLFLQTQKK